MKKLVLAILVAVAGVFSVNAQTTTTTTTTTGGSASAAKPVSGTKTFTFGIDGLSSFNLSGASQAGGTLLFRYYLADDLAVRLGVNYTRYKEHNEYKSPGADPTETDSASNSFYFVPGIQKSFGSNAKVEPYAGIDLLIGRTRSRAEAQGPSGTYEAKYAPTTSIGLLPAVGFNWWVVQGLAIGAEFNWGPRWNFIGESETTVAGTTTNSQTTGRRSSWSTSGTGLITVSVAF